MSQIDYEAIEKKELKDTNLYIALMIKKLNVTKDDIIKELSSFYAKYGKDGAITYSEVRKWVSKDDHRRRIAVLLMLLKSKFSALNDALTVDFRKMLNTIMKDECITHSTESHDLMPLLDMLTEDGINTKWGSDNLNWQDRLSEDVDKWFSTESVNLKRDIIRQSSIEEVIENVDEQFNTMEKVLERLALTESSAIGSQTRHKIFKELGYDKYRYYTQADERTCEICSSMHNLVFPMSAYEIGVTASPMHPRCRCWEVPFKD